MKRELILIRHTKSSWKDLNMTDFDRPLKKDRLDDAKNMGKLLRDMNLKPDLIICSPALRTKQTAEIFCGKLAYDFKKVQFDRRIYESTAAEILQVVRETEAHIKSLVVVGHNPSLTDFANLFLKTKSIDELPTTGVVWLEIESPDWEIYKTTPCNLKAFLSPDSIS